MAHDHGHSHSHGHGHHHEHESEDEKLLKGGAPAEDDAEDDGDDDEEEEEELEPKARLILICVSAALFIWALLMTNLIQMPWWAKALIYFVPYIAAGWPVLKEAAECFAHREFFEEATLMTVATVGAFIIGEYPEGAAVMILFNIGELLEDLASDRSRRSIEKLMELRPDTANVETESGIKETPADDVEVGSVIVVKPGERVPLDGEVIEGSTSLDMSALTGESAPRDVSSGESIVSGAVNLRSAVRVRVTKPAGESTVSRILELVEDAGERKAEYQSFTERFAHIYTPVVVGAALVLAVLPPILSGFTGWREWIYRALEFLVVSCPCAFVISVPMTFVSGIGAASKKGVIVKGSAFIERLAAVKAAVFDKTGTLTEGKFAVTQICPEPGVTEEELIRFCALAEKLSDHPVAASLREKYDSMGYPPADDEVGLSENIAGKGVITEIGGSRVACGSAALMEDFGVPSGAVVTGGGAVHAAVKNDGGVRYLGRVMISDRPKTGAAEAVSALKAAGVTRLVMLTGDHDTAAKAVADSCGISEYHAGLMPEDKVTELEKVMDVQPKNARVAFIGDGVNDAPVLARADVGIAMGALGSDAAIEAADVVIMDDDPRRAAQGVGIARKTMRVVAQNVILAIGLKAVILILCAVGLAPMWAAVFGDVGVTILCCLNALRAGRVRE